MSATDQLIEALIQSQKETNDSVKDLSNKMGELITIEAGRLEREKHQLTKNEKYDKFIENNENILIRLRKFYDRLDKAGDKVFVLVIFGLLTAAGFNWLV